MDSPNVLTPLGVFLILPGITALITLIRWINDANMTGWRLRRWERWCNSGQGRAWKPWFAWRPVCTISGRRRWLTRVYRQVGNTYVDYDSWTWYYYADIYEVLKFN